MFFAEIVSAKRGKSMKKRLNEKVFVLIIVVARQINVAGSEAHRPPGGLAAVPGGRCVYGWRAGVRGSAP